MIEPRLVAGLVDNPLATTLRLPGEGDGDRFDRLGGIELGCKLDQQMMTMQDDAGDALPRYRRG